MFENGVIYALYSSLFKPDLYLVITLKCEILVPLI